MENVSQYSRPYISPKMVADKKRRQIKIKEKSLAL